MNSSIQRLLLGKTEAQAVAILNQFNCKWRVIVRDGRNSPNLPQDRDDTRYNLVIRDGIIERIIAG